MPANTDEQNPNILDLFANDDPGTILNIYRSATAAIGTHVATSASSVNFPVHWADELRRCQGAGAGRLPADVRHPARLNAVRLRSLGGPRVP